MATSPDCERRVGDVERPVEAQRSAAAPRGGVVDDRSRGTPTRCRRRGRGSPPTACSNRSCGSGRALQLAPPMASMDSDPGAPGAARRARRRRAAAAPARTAAGSAPAGAPAPPATRPPTAHVTDRALPAPPGVRASRARASSPGRDDLGRRPRSAPLGALGVVDDQRLVRQRRHQPLAGVQRDPRSGERAAHDDRARLHDDLEALVIVRPVHVELGAGDGDIEGADLDVPASARAVDDRERRLPALEADGRAGARARLRRGPGCACRPRWTSRRRTGRWRCRCRASRTRRRGRRTCRTARSRAATACASPGARSSAAPTCPPPARAPPLPGRAAACAVAAASARARRRRPAGPARPGAGAPIASAITSPATSQRCSRSSSSSRSPILMTLPPCSPPAPRCIRPAPGRRSCARRCAAWPAPAGASSSTAAVRSPSRSRPAPSSRCNA